MCLIWSFIVASVLPSSGSHDDTLKDHLMEDIDYSLVPEGGWNKLLIWYGLAEGSRPIARNVIEWGVYVKHLKVRKECSSGELMSNCMHVA